MIKVKIFNSIATLSEGVWDCEQSGTLALIKTVSRSYNAGTLGLALDYDPNEERRHALAVVTELRGEILEVVDDFEPPSDSETVVF